MTDKCIYTLSWCDNKTNKYSNGMSWTNNIAQRGSNKEDVLSDQFRDFLKVAFCEPE